MKIITYKNHNSNAKHKANPSEIIEQAFVGTNLVLTFLGELKPELTKEYITALKKRLTNDVQDFHFDSTVFDLDAMRTELTVLKEHLDVQELLVQLICKYLNPPKRYQPGQEGFDVLLINWLKAYLLWRYYRAKAFADALGREAGIKLWKEIAILLADYSLEKNEERPPIKEVAEQWMKSGTKNKNNSLMDFTVVIYDDFRVLVKFDRCGVHEALKYLNDPEFAYLSYCYVGDVEDVRTTKVRRRRRTQTLHLGEFCDEFFWNNDVYKDAEHPSLEFMRKLGRED